MNRLWTTFFAVLFTVGSAAAQDRRVEVSRLDDDVRRTAHLLGVSEEKVRDARKWLIEATDLAFEMAGELDLRSLSAFWVYLDNREALPRMERFLTTLQREAGRATDRGVFDHITRNARLIALDLQRLDEQFGERILENWPDPPPHLAGGADPEQSRRLKEEVIGRKIWSDLDGALEEMEAFEDGKPSMRLRSLALTGLARAGRFEEANALLDETIAFVSENPPDLHTQHNLSRIIRDYARYGDPKRTEELIGLWAQTGKSLYADSEEHFTEIAGLEFTPFENQALNLVRSLGSRSPRTALNALEQFPGLVEKLETVGGYDSFLVQRIRSHGRRQPAADREDTPAARINSLLDSVNVNHTRNPDEASKSLAEAARLIRRLENPILEMRYFKRLASTYFRVEGQIPGPVRVQGFEIVEVIRDGPSSGEEGSYAQHLADAEQLETVLYGIWIWSDPASARPALEKLQPGLRYQAIAGFLTQISRTVRRQWRF